MLNRLSLLLYKISTPLRGVLVTLMYALFIATVMPAQSADSAMYAGEWGAPDGHLWYSPNQLYAAIGNWNAAGRADYISFRLGLDIIWALAYGGFLIAWTSCALRYSTDDGDHRRLLNTLPVLTICADYTENALGIILVANADTRIDALAWLATTATGVKWLSLGAAHLVLLYAITLAARARQRNR